jgi:hypothetical protein
MPTRDDDQAELDPREYPEPDAGDDGAAGTRPCPRCKAPVYEEAERCPYCGNWFGDGTPASARPWWFVAGAILALAVAILWALLY